MELRGSAQYGFTLTCSQQESEVVHAAIAQPALEGPAEDFDRARAHDRLKYSLPQSCEPWKIAISALELRAIHRATRNLQYHTGLNEEMRADAAAFTNNLVEQGYTVEHYLA